MKAVVRACAVLAPGLPDWAGAADVLSGRAPYRRAPVRELVPLELPANERRRAPETARWALAVGADALRAAGIDAGEVATVLSSCGSDGPITNQICEALARPARTLSPTQFHNSVHNAAAGYWSLAHDTHAPSTSLCAGTASFSAGLLEACAQVGCEHRDVLLIAYDIPYPEPLSGLWNVPEPFAAAFVLAQAGEGHRIEVGMGAAAADGADHWPGGLPTALQANPAAACAPLLALLAGATPGEVFLPYLDGCSVRVTLCR